MSRLSVYHNPITGTPSWSSSRGAWRRCVVRQRPVGQMLCFEFGLLAVLSRWHALPRQQAHSLDDRITLLYLVDSICQTAARHQVTLYAEGLARHGTNHWLWLCRSFCFHH
jgi:hypothetical protein